MTDKKMVPLKDIPGLKQQTKAKWMNDCLNDTFDTSKLTVSFSDAITQFGMVGKLYLKAIWFRRFVVKS